MKSNNTVTDNTESNGSGTNAKNTSSHFQLALTKDIVTPESIRSHVKALSRKLT